MQRQDDFLIARTDMLLFIAQLLSLADGVIRIVASDRTIDDRLLHAFARCEIAMLIVLSGIVSNTDTRGATRGLNDMIDVDEPPHRQAELLRIGASFQQIAMALALILSTHPRAFRDRHRLSHSSFRGGEAQPGTQSAGLGAICAHFSGAHFACSISGFRIRFRSSAMTSSTARAPP